MIQSIFEDSSKPCHSSIWPTSRQPFFLGQSQRTGNVYRVGRRSSLGRFLHRIVPRPLVAWYQSVQRVLGDKCRKPDPNYRKVLFTFARNSLVRDMSFRMNFIMQCITSICWAMMNFGLFKIIYGHANTIGEGWGENQFFIFLGTIWIINSLVQTFVMANATEFSELIRTGNLDFRVAQTYRYAIPHFVSKDDLGSDSQWSPWCSPYRVFDESTRVGIRQFDYHFNLAHPGVLCS